MEFSVRGANAVTQEQLEACARLFSAQYGVWGEGAPSRVRLSASKLKEQYMFDESCCLAMATTLPGGEIVGHAFATSFSAGSGGERFGWITQLVVDERHRSRGVASKLCRLAWDVRATAGCCIVTSHPHALLALKRATRGDHALGTAEQARALLDASGVPWTQGSSWTMRTSLRSWRRATSLWCACREIVSLLPGPQGGVGRRRVKGDFWLEAAFRGEAPGGQLVDAE